MASEWQTVDSPPPLEPGELQLWRFDLADEVREPEVYRRHLTRVELERADRLRAGQVRQQFLATRACLRLLLGKLLHLAPELVPITLTAYGKPETSAAHTGPLHFNIAHSRETILIALCRSSEVGVDLEHANRETEILEIARNYFTLSEFSQMEQISDPNRQRWAFFQAWTRKEAVIKADGRGLSLPLDSVEVPVVAAARSAPVFVADRQCSANPETWFVTDVQLGDQIAAAFAVAIPDLHPRTFKFHQELFFARL